LETVKICTSYIYRGEVIDYYPASLKMLSECEAVYEELPGWQEDISAARTLEDLPESARHYVERVSQLTGIPISIFSVGRNREQTNLVRPIYS
jgi:adenylosuccinate synthase